MVRSSTRPAHRPSTREAMLAAAEAHLRTQGTLSLETAARAGGVTKAGLMYHFPTKEDLMASVLDRLMGRYQDGLTKRLVAITGSGDPGSASVVERLSAYVSWACEAKFDQSDLVMFTDPRLRETLTRRWVDQLEPWLEIPDDLPVEHQARLRSARLIADGMWFAISSGSLRMTKKQREGVRTVALNLMEVTG